MERYESTRYNQGRLGRIGLERPCCNLCGTLRQSLTLWSGIMGEHKSTVVGEVVKDGTGAPATIHVAGQIFTADYRGAVILKRVGGEPLPFPDVRQAMSRAKRLYMTWLVKNAGPGWIGANCARYR